LSTVDLNRPTKIISVLVYVLAEISISYN
jgi:hypothetical protein